MASRPIRLMSWGNSHRASYSRKPVGLTSGRRSKSAVLGARSARGFGNMQPTPCKACWLTTPETDNGASPALGHATRGPWRLPPRADASLLQDQRAGAHVDTLQTAQE